MKYRIGDVSRILGISDQMIRYYEKCGVIQPERSGDGRYRYYTDMDVFLLFEAMKYKEWDINIGDIASMISDNYYTALIQRLSAFEKKLDEEEGYRQAMKERVSWVRRRLKLSIYNTGNVWIDIMPEHCLYYLGESDGDEYEISGIDPRMAEIIYSSKYIPFFDPYVEYTGNHGTWWYIIWKDLHDRLKLPDYGNYKLVPEQTVLISSMDMGLPGEFSSDKYQHLTDYALSHGYQISGPVCGVITGRGNKDQQFQRMMQIMAPIGTL